MSTDIPTPPAAPISKDSLCELLFYGAMAPQGFSVEQAGKLLRTSDRMAARAERHAAGVLAARETATREAAERKVVRVADTGSEKPGMYYAK